MQTAKERLEYIRGEIVAERISYGEIAELQSLIDYIDPGDVLLMEWAGVPEDDSLTSACNHNEMVTNNEPGFAWKCSKCGYVYGKTN